MSCRFEMRIRNTDRFQCAAKFGMTGWAYTWTHSEDEFRDPCVRCPIYIVGTPLLVNTEISRSEFPEIAGERIRKQDWKELEKRGYSIGVRGIRRI